ncbi:MAG: BamA/TamA family outer membrane protein [Chitinophagaceae bacterium]
MYRSLRVCCLLAFVLTIALKTHAQADSITLAVKPAYDSVTGAHRFFLGENYRRLWATPVTVRVLSLSKEKGGLSIVKQGGGLQTRSLRLRDATGKEWVLRTMEKYPERKLPANLKASIVKDILTDQITTANPFAALTVPPFAKALGIPHANPEIVYIKDDTALGEYSKDFANKVFLFEEREAEGDADSDNTLKVQQKLRDDNDISIDRQIVLRARLLDMLLGDWDRHEDQWRWQKAKNKKTVVYTPIPRDRDQVYYMTSGVFPWIVSHQFLMSKFQGFHESIRDIKGWNVNARYFDRYFLNGLSEADWEKQIAYVQQQVTDSLVRQAIELLPVPIFAQVGEHTIQTLLARRANLPKLALEYYRFISKTVDIPASDKHEYFDIQYPGDGKVMVQVYKINKNGEKEQVMYQRTFEQHITKEIRLYAFDNSDVFAVTGNGRSRIKVRMIGGTGKDSFNIASGNLNKGRLFIYDLKKEDNYIPHNVKAKLRLDTDSSVNAYNPQSFKYDLFGPVFSADYNNDDRLILKVGLLKQLHGFRKEPYASRQEFWVNYSTGRNFFRFIYDGDFKKVLGNNDLLVHLYSRGPHYIRNFFGIGNETAFPNSGNYKILHYRARFDYITGDIRLRHPLTKYLSWNAGIRAQYYTASAENNVGNSLDSFNTANPGTNVYGGKYYIGPAAGMVFDSRNNTTLPSHGMYVQLNGFGLKKLNDNGNSFVQFTIDADHYLSLTRDSTIIMANRIGLGTTGGQPDFFQYLYLGGSTNLRGFRSYRFAGKSFAYHNIEMRVKLFDFVSYLLPGTVGLTVFNDVGRVWQPGESSSKWHDGYGGGVYIRPAELALIQFQMGHSTEGWIPYIKLGFRF